jgi:hypothetical protein
MNGWIKRYSDGSRYIGDDREVYAGRASWTKSSMQNLVRVDLVVNGEVRFLSGVGPYWQSDTFESVFPGGSCIIKRRIQRQISPGDIGHTPEEIGKWSTLEYDCRTKQWSCRLTEGRI